MRTCAVWKDVSALAYLQPRPCLFAFPIFFFFLFNSLLDPNAAEWGASSLRPQLCTLTAPMLLNHTQAAHPPPPQPKLSSLIHFFTCLTLELDSARTYFHFFFLSFPQWAKASTLSFAFVLDLQLAEETNYCSFVEYIQYDAPRFCMYVMSTLKKLYFLNV